ncbi:4Fe-4S binding protein [Microvirga sp. VF16]|uniref:4Fe-4S binding protein n=1 Tax=Microvirga sp. VF16 TaxID=2807101 RepID=UPI00193E6BD7|nr:4Fe-4S binding protein [Microvirga sp. VF16]QRM30339.1 4Fe-4S binding protein [Microvirga sp. VF16]
MTEVVDQRRRSFLLGGITRGDKTAGPLSAVIAPSCFALQGIACMSCRDVCPTGAMRFELALGGARPRIMTDACSACGDCIQSCPADAIRISASEVAS